MLWRKRFVRTKEDFVCEICGSLVKGDGYTDHCPVCLWSKHVDVFPGDRRSSCGGLMEPIVVAQKRGKWRILYRCCRCGYQHWNKASVQDNLARIVELSKMGQGEKSKAVSTPKRREGRMSSL